MVKEKAESLHLTEIPLRTSNVDRNETHPPIHNVTHSEIERADKNGQLSDSSSDNTATGSSDEFNWDEEEGAESKNPSGHVKARRLRGLYLLFMKLSRWVRTLLVAIIGAGIFITPLLVVTFRFQQNPAKQHVYAWSLWFSIIWAAACLTYLVVDLLPRLIISLVVLFGGHVERLKIQIELTLAVSGWLKLALDVAWAWISLSVIRAVYKPPGSYWHTINRVLQAMFAAAVIILAEKIFLQFVAINFHQKALADRITENTLGLKALDRLSNAQPATIKGRPYGKKGHKSFVGSFGTSVDFGAMNHQEAGKNTPPGNTEKKAERQKKRKKAVASVIVDQLSGAIGQVALKDSKFNRQGEMGGLHSARRLARKLFSTLSDVRPPRSHLLVDDFYPYFKTPAEAQAAFALFDKDGNGDITKREMREAVQRIYRERKALTSSLKDVSSAVAKLDAVLLGVALIGIIFVCLLIFNRENTLASLVPLATIILGFSFIFGHSAQILFESLIFIFSTHVFDVGDLVLIDDQPLFVQEFGLFSTTFRRVDGQEIIAPNNLLASTKLIHNLRRSNSMWETTTIMVSYDTPLEVIESIRTQVANYVTANNREWSASNLNIDKMEFQNAMHLVIGMEHRPNWQDWGGRWARRTAFMRNLKAILEDLDVQYTMPIQPVLLPGNVNPSNTFNPNTPYPHSGFGNLGGGPAGRFTASRETLGNAGSFQPSQYARAPTRAMSGGGGDGF